MHPMLDGIVAFFTRLYSNGFPDEKFWIEICLSMLEFLLNVVLGLGIIWITLGIATWMAWGKWPSFFSDDNGK